MRILPLIYYLEKLDKEQQFEITHQVSRLTHGHLRSQMACGIYTQLGINLLKGMTPRMAYERIKDTVLEYYSKKPYNKELDHFSIILEYDISKLSEDSLKSDGYVVNILGASLWCFLNNNSYENTVFTTVNLGDNTDTTGAVVRRLAGIFYGNEGLPQKWVKKVARAKDIIRLGERVYEAIYGV